MWCVTHWYYQSLEYGTWLIYVTRMWCVTDFLRALALDTINHQNMVRDLFMSLECGARLVDSVGALTRYYQLPEYGTWLIYVTKMWCVTDFLRALAPDTTNHRKWCLLICVIRMWCVTDFLRTLALHTINYQNMVRDLFMSLECGAWLIFWEHWHSILSMTRIWYGVATVSRIDKIIGLFCRISSLL